MRLPFAVCLLVTVLLADQAQCAAPPGAACPVGMILSGGKKVRAERFEPRGTNRLPAVVLLHGLDGMPDRGGLYRCLARRLAARGYVVMLVHYLDRTATRKDDLPGLLKRFRTCLEAPHTSGKQWRRVRGTFEAWRATVADAVAHARTLRRVDPDRIGLAGFSMGGFLATSAAMQPELRISCVVEVCGGLPDELAARVKHMPPTLILHGESDEVVPVRHARNLGQMLARQQLPFELTVYRGLGHGFQTSSGRTSWWAALDAEARAVRFLARHLAARKMPTRRADRTVLSVPR